MISTLSGVPAAAAYKCCFLSVQIHPLYEPTKKRHVNRQSINLLLNFNLTIRKNSQGLDLMLTLITISTWTAGILLMGIDDVSLQPKPLIPETRGANEAFTQHLQQQQTLDSKSIVVAYQGRLQIIVNLQIIQSE